MQISDLVAIGKLGKFIDKKGFIPFREYKNYHLQTDEDVFLLFTDNRVRYVTITEINTQSSLKIKIDDAEIQSEAALDGNVTVMLSQNDVDHYFNESNEEDLIGMPVYFLGKKLGKIVESFFNGAQEIITIQTEIDKEILIPLVDKFIREINADRIILQDVQDFLEL
jgi:ribosomal 30S subunit maturation factor RimM